MNLNELYPFAEDRKSRKRVGRGSGSGLGCTSGKGNKGQNARAGGGVRPGFEGGQMPLQRRLPKRGFKSAQLQFNAEVTLADLNGVDAAEIDILVLKQVGLVAQLAKRVKVIKTGDITRAVKLKNIAATAGAKAAIEAAGGSLA